MKIAKEILKGLSTRRLASSYTHTCGYFWMLETYNNAMQRSTGREDPAKSKAVPNYVIINVHEHTSEPTSLHHAHMFNILLRLGSRRIKPLCNNKRIILLPSYNTQFCVARPSNTKAFNKPLAHKLNEILLQFHH